MNFKGLFFIILSLPILAGCGGSADRGSAIEGNYGVKYASRLVVNKTDDYTELIIINPWDTTRVLQNYILVPKENDLPEGLPKGTLVRTPVTKIVANSSPACSVMEELGVIERTVGVCESRYIDIEYIKQQVQSNLIPDLGEASSPDIERLIELNAECIMASPFQNVSYGSVSKLGIPIIECADYMETTPLGRAEWIRFYGLLFGREQQADSIFNITERNYLSLREKAGNVGYRPTVVTERKTGAAWYVPGGRSYLASMIKDAGAEYIFSDNESPGSVPLSIEEVFDKGSTADIWLIKYHSPKTLTYDELGSDEPLYVKFTPWIKKRVYGCNTMNVSYYEEMPMHPDLILADLIEIFHPELGIEKEKSYFSPIEQ